MGQLLLLPSTFIVVVVAAAVDHHLQWPSSEVMDAGAKKILDSVTIETLHAHNFSRSSTQATVVLTDLLSRYLALLSATCARYAQHAGRLRLTARDAINALDELGLGVDELTDYCASEARDLARYASHTARRAEDLKEFKGQSSRVPYALHFFMLYFYQLRWILVSRKITMPFLSCTHLSPVPRRLTKKAMSRIRPTTMQR